MAVECQLTPCFVAQKDKTANGDPTKKEVRVYPKEKGVKINNHKIYIKSSACKDKNI